MEIVHPAPAIELGDRPEAWTSARFEEADEDLCPPCSEAVRSLAASRRALRTDTEHAANGVYVSS